nr:MAG TPA: hypothetical protein [Caudoviricetes sp.]
MFIKFSTCSISITYNNETVHKKYNSHTFSPYNLFI